MPNSTRDNVWQKHPDAADVWFNPSARYWTIYKGSLRGDYMLLRAKPGHVTRFGPFDSFDAARAAFEILGNID